MFEDPCDGVEGGVGHAGVAFSSEGVLAVFPDREVDVHTAAVVAVEGFGHEGDGLAVEFGGIFDDVFVGLHDVGLADECVVFDVNFGLSGGGDFMVLAFDFDADLFEVEDHFAAEVLEGVDRGDGEVSAFVFDFVA